PINPALTGRTSNGDRTSIPDRATGWTGCPSPARVCTTVRAADRHRPRLRARRQSGRLARVPLRAGLGAVGPECHLARRPPPYPARALVDLPADGAAFPLPGAAAGRAARPCRDP